MLKLRTLFSGIGAPESALKNENIDYELINFCELDKFAIKSYCAVHGVSEDKNLGDISKINPKELEYADLMVWGFPCQDISVAGKQQGIIKGETRSGLYHYGYEILKETKPKWSIIENVKNLVSKKFRNDFEEMLKDIESLGYNNYWKVLNAKNYGIPQNRERVFIVSIRKDVDNRDFKWPQSFDNGLRLKDFLENEVDEKHYISQEKTEKLISQLKNGEFEPNVLRYERTKYGKEIRKDYEAGNITEKISNMREAVPRTDGVANTLTTVLKDNMLCVPCITPDRVEKRQNGRRFKEDGDAMFTLTGQDRHGILQVGNIVDTGNWGNPQRGRIYSTEGCCPSLNTVGGGGLEPKILKSDYRIRKLTPKECWRLMGFKDEEFQKAQDAGISNSQLYKQAGNSIVTNVLQGIMRGLITNEE